VIQGFGVETLFVTTRYIRLTSTDIYIGHFWAGALPEASPAGGVSIRLTILNCSNTSNAVHADKYFI
jgi:hypothetical protein